MAKGPSAMKLAQVKAIAGTPSSRAEQKGPSAEKLAEVRANAASGAASRVKTGQDYIIEALQGYGKTPTRYDTQYDPVTGFELATPGAAVKDAAAPAQKQSAQTKKSAFVPTEPKIDPNESAVEKLGRWMSGASSDTTTPVTPANDSTDYAMRRAMGGAVSSAAGFANAVGYYGQGALRGQLAQQEAQQKADYAVTGDAGSKALAEQKASQLKESEDKGLQTLVTWGDSFNRETAQDYDPDKTLKVVGDVTEGVGGMVPSILSNYFVPGSSLFVMAAGAAGNAVREAKQNGASDTAALTYGTAVGVVEAATEKMFDGVSGVFGKGLADDAIDALVQKYIGNEAAQKAVTVLVNTLGEGAEEFVAEVVENWINRVTANTDARRGKKLLGDAWYSFAVGGLVSAVMQAANAGNFDAKQVAQNAVDAMDSGVSDAGETQAKAEQTAQEKPAAKTGADYILEAEKAANGTPSAEAPTAAQEAPQAAVQTDTESAVPPVLNSFKTPPDAAERGANKAGSPAEIDPKDYAAALEAQREIEAGRAEPDTIRDTYTPRPQSGLHIDDRGYDDVSSRKVNAFQFDNPELHQYFVDAAGELLMQLNNTTKGERFAANLYFTEPDRPGGDSFLWTGTKRDTSPEIEQLLDNANLSYAQIRKAIDDLIADNGQENYAAAKKVELILNEMLTDGFEVEGEYIPANEEYIRKKEAIKNGENPNGYNMSEEEWNSLFSNEYNAPEENKGNDDGIGAKTAKFGYDEVETQTHSSDGLYTEMERTQDGIKAEDSTGAAPGGFTGDRAALDEKYMDAADKNGAMPERGNLSRQVPVPKSMDGETVIPRTVQTAMGSEVTPASQVGQTTQDVALGRFNYDSITDKSSVSRAEQTIRDKGFQQALTDWTADVRSGKVGKDLTTLGITLYNNAANSGDGKTAAVILADMVSSVRSGAQSTQAVNLFNKMDPQYQLYTIERSVQNMQDELTGKYRDKAPDLQIDPELVQTFLDADTDKARQDAMDSIYQNIADQMPSSWKDRFNAWRYLSMLGNPRTHIRNIIGNAGFAPVRVVKNLIASGIEAVSIGKNAGRTKSILMPTAEDYARVRAGWSDYDGVVDQIQSGGKFKSDYNEIRDRQTIFGFKPLEWVRRANNTALDAEDTWFSRPAYAESLASYLKANGVTAAEYLAEDYDRSAAQAYAIREAQKATYRDYNSFSDAISRIGFKNPKNAVEKGINTLVEGILPFKRTPANILVRAVEYSPAGLVKGLYDAAVNVRNGNVTAAEAIDEVSSGLTGTGLLTLGFFLAKMGLVNGGGSGDDKQDEFTKTKGIQNYSVNIGYKTYTLDWLAPEALPFFVGVEAFNRMSDGNMTGDDMWDSLKQITDPLVEMSMLQGVNDAIDSINYAVQGGSTGITAAITSPIVSYLSQFIPTLGGQIERTAEDETRQTTYVDRESIIPTDIQYAIAKAANKIPGVDYEQMDYIDAWGRTQSSGGAAQRAIGNFLGPGYISEKTGTPADSELERLYKAGYTGVYPSRVQASVRINGAYLTKDQYQTYAKEKGKTSLNLVTELVQSDYYSKLTDAQKAKAVSGMYDYAADLAAYKAVGDDWNSAWHKDASSQSTSDTADLIAYKAILAESSSADEAEQKALEIGISQKAVLSTLSDSAKSDYEKYIKDTDVDLKDYLSAYNFSNDAKREGTDENGAAPKERTIGYIDGMFSGDEYDDEKDAIYRALGFSESGLSKTPWHN